MKARSWYGLAGEIEVENELWHLVRIAGVPLHHPPIVNMVLRRGLPRADRLRLSYLHEFGHLQTLPLALAHAIFLLGRRRGQHQSLAGWLAWLAALAVAHEAVWEMASEIYVMASEGAAYRDTYRRTPNPLLPAFWAAMAGLGFGVSAWLIWRRH